MEISLTKRLSAKYRISVPKVYKKYQATFQEGKNYYKVLQVLIEREGKKPLVARWGGMRITLGYPGTQQGLSDISGSRSIRTGKEAPC